MGEEFTMIVDIYNEVYTKLKQELSPTLTLDGYPETTPEFPCVVIEELHNANYVESSDSGGDKHSAVSFEVNIFSTQPNKKSKSRKLRKKVDSVLSDFYGMNRDYAGTLPSFLDNNIYRHTMRYSFVIDKDKKLYRR